MNKSRPTYRQCVVTHESHLKEEMFRIVKTSSGVHFDKSQTLMGRGVYIKKDKEIILLAKRRNSFAKALKSQVNEEIYDLLIKEIEEKRD